MVEVMKVLCVCQGGNTRSVAMAYVLKKNYKIDALSCGYRDNSVTTLKMLFDWSDLIIAMDNRILRHIPVEHSIKTKLCDVGTDRWGSIKKEKDLLKTCDDFWKGLKL